MKEIIWTNKYIYSKKINIDSYDFGLLVDDSDISCIMVYGVALLNKNKSWDDLKRKSESLEYMYKLNEELKSLYIEL